MAVPALQPLEGNEQGQLLQVPCGWAVHASKRCSSYIGSQASMWSKNKKLRDAMAEAEEAAKEEANQAGQPWEPPQGKVAERAATLGVDTAEYMPGSQLWSDEKWLQRVEEAKAWVANVSSFKKEDRLPPDYSLGTKKGVPAASAKGGKPGNTARGGSSTSGSGSGGGSTGMGPRGLPPAGGGTGSKGSSRAAAAVEASGRDPDNGPAVSDSQGMEEDSPAPSPKCLSKGATNTTDVLMAAAAGAAPDVQAEIKLLLNEVDKQKQKAAQAEKAKQQKERELQRQAKAERKKKQKKEEAAKGKGGGDGSRPRRPGAGQRADTDIYDYPQNRKKRRVTNEDEDESSGNSSGQSDGSESD